jgi:DNA-3-methyladenine glycosylase II
MSAADFTVRLDRSIDYASSLEMFRRSGDDLMDRWNGSTFVRVITIDESPVAYACTFETAKDAVNVHVTLEDARYCDEIESVVSAMFLVPPEHFAELMRHDPVIAALDARYPGVRSVRQPNLFVALIRCISTQQVNLRWAATCRRRLAETFGRPHRINDNLVYSLDPARIANLEIADIRELQFTNSKSEYIINVAREIASNGLTMATLDRLSNEDLIARLTAIRGVGIWSAEWILARTLGWPRVVAGDLGVRKAVGVAYFDGARPTENEVRRATAHWGESAAVAQALLLHALAEKTLAEVVADADGALAPSAATATRPTNARNSACVSPRRP